MSTIVESEEVVAIDHRVYSKLIVFKMYFPEEYSKAVSNFKKYIIMFDISTVDEMTVRMNKVVKSFGVNWIWVSIDINASITTCIVIFYKTSDDRYIQFTNLLSKLGCIYHYELPGDALDLPNDKLWSKDTKAMIEKYKNFLFKKDLKDAYK